MFRNGNDSSDGHAEALPRYSEYPEDCQLVIEAMIERVHNVKIKYSQDSTLWTVSFGTTIHEDVELSKAVCLAALAESKNQD